MTKQAIELLDCGNHDSDCPIIPEPCVWHLLAAQVSEADIAAAGYTGALTERSLEHLVGVLGAARNNAIANRDALYRVFRALALGDRARLATVDEVVQADVDAVVAERIRLKDDLANANKRAESAELKSSERAGIIEEQRVKFADLERERDKWRAATGLSNLTPSEAGNQIDREDEEREAAKAALEVAKRTQCSHATGAHDEECDLVAGLTADNAKLWKSQSPASLVTIGECLEALAPLDEPGKPNCLIDLIRRAMSEIERLKQEVETLDNRWCDLVTESGGELARLNKWITDLQSGIQVNCVYCGHHYGPRESTAITMADVLKEHIEKCSRHPLAKARVRIDGLREALKEHNRLFAKIDKAMATPDRIAQDTQMVGGFVSNLDSTETAEQIVTRAIEAIKAIKPGDPHIDSTDALIERPQ